MGVLPAEPLSRETLLDQASQWAAALQAVETALSKSATSEEWSLEQLRQSASRIVETACRLPSPLAVDAEDLLPLLGSPAVAGTAQTLLDALQGDAEMESAVSRRFVRRPDPLPPVELIQRLVAALSQWRIGSLAIPPEQPEREQFRHRLRQAAHASDRLEVLLEASTTGLALAGFSPASLDTLLPLVEHLGSQPDWVLRQRREAIWSVEPQRAHTLVGEHNALQDLRAQLNLDQAAAQQPSDIDLDQAIRQVQRCCDRGLGAVLAEANAAERWAEQLDQAQALLHTADAGLTACMPSDLRQTAGLEQLLTLPELLEAVLALDADAIPLRSSPLWSVDLKALQVALDGEQELQRREHALQQQGLRVILGTRASALRESADLLEKQPLFKNLLNQLSGTTGRALKLAREIGANDPAQRPSALRDVAKVVELRESYGPGWKKRMVSLELPSHRLLPITEQLQSLKKILETSSHGPVWGGWLREATAEDLQAALTAYGQGLESTLRALTGHAVWPSAVLEQSLCSLQTRLHQSKQDQALLAAVEPVARWARAAGFRDGVAMVDWLQQVQSTIQRQDQFPQQELQALLAGGLEVDQVEAVLSAAERTRVLVASSSLGAEAEALMAADQTALSQAVLTLQHQLAPLVQELMREGDLLPTDANQRPLAQLAKGIQETSQGYQALLQQWQDSGLSPDASLPDLLQLPIDLALAHRRREELSKALASFQQQAGEEIAGTAPELLRQVMGWIGALRQAGLPADVEDHCLKPGSAAFIAEQRARAEQLVNALDTEEAAAQRFIATAKPNPLLIGDGGTDDISTVKAKDLKSWLEAVVANRSLYPTWVERHQVLEHLPADGVRRLAGRVPLRGVNPEARMP